MGRYIIEGGKTLDGKITIKAAKNSVLPLLAASILTTRKVTLTGCPDITDIRNMLKILRKLGCKTSFDDGVIEVDSSLLSCGEIPTELAKELRSSIFLLGALLSRLKKAKVAYPGGCDIGMRPVDIHLEGLRALGIEINEQGGYIVCDGENAASADIVLDLPSVGATENLMLASIFIKGRTIIRNCAKEPELVDLQNFLNAMGADVRGAGGSVIAVEGVETLHGCCFKPIPDRIAAGTYLIGAAMCGGNLELENVVPEHISSLVSKLSKTTCKITRYDDKLYIRSNGRHNALGTIETMYYPGFPTDLQAQMMAMQAVAKGTAVIVENIFETRFKTAGELKKMGADVTVKGRTAIVRGVPYLTGAEVAASDLRGGASLVLAGMAACGITVVEDVHHIDRGYENLEFLADVGVTIKRQE